MLLVPSRSSNATKSGTKVHLWYSSGAAFHKKQGYIKLSLFALAFHSTCPACVPRCGCSQYFLVDQLACGSWVKDPYSARVIARLRPQSDTVSRASTLFLPGFLRTRGRQAEKRKCHFCSANALVVHPIQYGRCLQHPAEK